MSRKRSSAGLLMYRRSGEQLEFLLVHPGGPYFRRKDAGAWTIPKGEIEPDEEPLAAAQREFTEETGITPTGPFLPLEPIRQKGGKQVQAWAFAGDCDPTNIVSNTFTLEWPPKSGKQTAFPEIDRASFFDLTTARQKINPAQIRLLEELQQKLESE